MPHSRPPVKAGRHAKRFSECPCEGLQRVVVGIEGDVRNGALCISQLKSSALEQQAPPHCTGSFFDKGSKQPVKLRAALVRTARQLFRRATPVERVQDDPGQTSELTVFGRSIHAAGSSSSGRWYTPVGV